MIDEQGYRANVGIVLINQHNRVFWGRRIGQQSWQFPQGGVHDGETAEQALFRELHEEIGLEASDVQVLCETDDWLAYRLPKRLIRYHSKPICIGQKQKWFCLRLKSDETKIKLDNAESPEFDAWRWVSYWYPLRQVIAFKRRVYRLALKEFSKTVFKDKKEIENK